MRTKAALVSIVVIGVAAWLWLRTAPSQGKPGGSTTPTTTKEPTSPGLARARSTDPGDPQKKKAVDKQGRTLFSASWGGKVNELGRERPAEGNAQGPMSFGVDGKGAIYVVDTVNGRLVRRNADGSPGETTFLDSPYPEDVAVAEDGSAAVLDRHRDKAVSLYDESGKSMGKLPLQGEGLPDPGSVTGVFVDGKDVYVEKEHGPLLKLGTMGGIPAQPRTEIPGRPSRDGLSYINAGIIQAPAGRVYVSSIDRATNKHRFTRELALESLVRSIVLLDTDKGGTIYFAADVEKGGGSVLLYCLDGISGTPMGTAVLPANTLPEESFRDYVVLDGGGVVQALRTEQGVSYSFYDCQ